MPTLFIEMPSGMAGDMLLAALIDLGADAARITADLAALDCGDLRLRVATVSVGGITAKQVDVEGTQENDPHPAHDHHHHGHDHLHGHGHQHVHVRLPQAHHHGPPADGGQPHRPWRGIRDRIAAAALPERVKRRAQQAFRLLAEAESQVHGVAADDVEFHEVGSVDAIADVVGCCLALEQLGIGRIVAGALRPGRGWVTCAHGRIPVPVPAVTAILARTGAPCIQEATDTGELTTPTGAALVCSLADAWLTTPMAMTLRRVGYGAGHRIIPGGANAVRACLVDDDLATDQVAELCCHIDDATGEQLAALVDLLLAEGALDACLVPALMKKGRPGHVLTVLCAPDDRQRITGLVLRHSTSIGVRHRLLERTVLPRRTVTVQVAGQAVRLKVVTLPDGGERAKPEADDIIALARSSGRPVAELQQLALEAWRRTATSS